MPKRGSQSVHDNDYNWLVAVFGETCINCGAPPEQGLRLQIDHISYDPQEYDLPANKSLTCPKCNNWLRDIDALDPLRPQQHRAIIEAKRQERLEKIALERRKALDAARGTADSKLIKAYKKAVRASGKVAPLLDDSFKNEVLEYNNGSSEMKANVRYYKEFDALVRHALFRARKPLPEKSLLNLGALKLHASQTTLKRYLDGWTADDKDAPFRRIDDGGEWKIWWRNPSAGLGKGAE